MQKNIVSCFLLPVLLSFPVRTPAQILPMKNTDSPFSVSQSGNTWTIAGKRLTVTLREADLLLTVRCGSALWEFQPSSANDLTVRNESGTSKVRLAAAWKKVFVPVSDDSGPEW